MKVQAIIPAAGSGRRLKAKKPKVLIPLHQKPILYYTLSIFQQCSLVESVILVGAEDFMGDFQTLIDTGRFSKVTEVVVGGLTRCDSVKNGLKNIDKDTEAVVIHDGARPFLSLHLLEKAIKGMNEFDAVTVGVKVKSTVKRVYPQSGIVKETLNREELWEIQTPQVFKKDILVRAHQQKISDGLTDDAVLVERLGIPVKVLEGDYRNIKITTQEDLKIAEVFLVEAFESKIYSWDKKLE